MLDRLKYRVLDKKTKTYLDENLFEIRLLPNGKVFASEDYDDSICGCGLQVYTDDELIVEFCTSLYDSTKWDDLAPAEKKKFYSEVCSPNGKSIKYQNIEDVKHLWKGKLIFEGDILEYPKLAAGKKHLIKIEYFNHSLMAYAYGMDEYWSLDDILNSVEVNSPYKIIGNIHENPELLEVQQ